MLIRRPEVRTRQPQVPCGINQSIPGLIVAGVPLLFCSRPISNLNSQNIAKVITKSGLGAQYSAYGASEVYLGKSLSEYTIVAIADIAHTSSERHLVDFDWYGVNWRGFQLRAVNHTIEFIPFDSAGNPAFCNVNTVAQSSVIRPVVVVARQKAGIAKLDTSLGSASTSELATCRGLTSSLPVVVGQYAYGRNFSSDPISGYAVIDGFMSDAGVARIIDNPWQIFAPERRTLFVTSGAGGTLNASASGTASTSGTADLAAQVALAAVGVSTADGAGNLAASIPLLAAGLSVSGGNADATATVTLSAAGLAQAAGAAGLSASVLLAGAGAAQTAGNATLAAQLNALAAGAAQSGGSANLTGGAPGEISASGGDVASGSAVLSVTVQLQAMGSAQASGSATGQASTPGQVAAAGGGEASGAASWSVTATLTAAGFVRAMGAGYLLVDAPLAAQGSVNSFGVAYIGASGVNHHFQLTCDVTLAARIVTGQQLLNRIHAEVCRV